MSSTVFNTNRKKTVKRAKVKAFRKRIFIFEISANVKEFIEAKIVKIKA